MKNLLKVIALSLVVFFGTTSVSAAVVPFEDGISFDEFVGGWEKLGSRKVNYGLDRDEIMVTRAEGTFRKVQLRFKKAPINMHRMILHFGNGTQQEVKLQKTFRAGEKTRVIDIKGGKRVIKKVVFWYDTKNLAAKRGKVELWGKH